jgi:uncharacterized membrane-anchored protein
MKSLKKFPLFWMTIIFQIVILGSFIGRYEYLKATGQELYIETTGYDPNDLFRWDYVNVRYRLPVPKEYNFLFSGNTNIPKLYIVPKVENKIITGITSVSKEKPKSDLFFIVKNTWPQSSQKFVIEDQSSKQTVTYSQDWGCDEKLYKIGEKVLFSKYNGNTIGYITKYTPESISKEMTEWIVKEIGKCNYTITVNTPQADKFYVQSGQWTDLQNKIQAGSMYAKWKVSSNGVILFEDIVEKKDIK